MIVSSLIMKQDISNRSVQDSCSILEAIAVECDLRLDRKQKLCWRTCESVPNSDLEPDKIQSQFTGKKSHFRYICQKRVKNPSNHSSG